MKHALSLILAACLTLPISALEYVTLSNSQKTLNVASSSRVEVVGFTNWLGSNSADMLMLEFTLASGDVVTGPLIAARADSSAIFPVTVIGQKFTNVAQLRVYRYNEQADLENGAVTLKITPAAEIDSAGPKTVLVIPEGSTGDYDVLIESSGDMVTWTPMHSQTVSGSGPQHFFRTRIIKK